MKNRAGIKIAVTSLALLMAVGLLLAGPAPPVAAAPAAPTGLAANPVSTTQIDLSWNSVSGATAYEIWRSTGTSTSYSKIATVTVRTYSNTGLTPATAYNYKVRGMQGTTAGAFCAPVSTYSKPATPSSLWATTASTTQVDLSWTAVTGATGYQVWRSTGTSTSYSKIATVTARTYNNTGLTSGTRYNYKVCAVAGTVAGSSTAVKSAYTIIPAGLTLSTISTSQINLSWTAVSGATSYEVWRSTGTSTTYAKISSPTAAAYNNTGLTAGTRHNYKVRAAISTALTGFSAVKTAYTKPATPTGLKATSVSGTQINLSWTVVSGATSYEVWRSTGTSTTYSKIASPTAAAYNNTGLTSGTKYNYKVRAVNSGGTGAYCTPVSAWAHYQENSGKIRYFGAWSRPARSNYSGGYQATINTTGAVMIYFTGTAVNLMATKGPAYGKMNVTLDGTTLQAVDLYNVTGLYVQKVYTKTGLANATHTLLVEWSGLRNGASSNYTINLDAIEVPAGTLTQVPDMSGGLLVGDWSTPADPLYFTQYHFRTNGTYQWTATTMEGSYSLRGWLQEDGLYFASAGYVVLFDRIRQFHPAWGNPNPQSSYPPYREANAQYPYSLYNGGNSLWLDDVDSLVNNYFRILPP